MKIKLSPDRPTPQPPTTTRCACSRARSSTPRRPTPQKASTAPHQCSSGVLFPTESFIPLLPAWCLSCLPALVWQACVAARPRFGARWARPTTTDPAAVAAGSFARLGRSSSRRAPCASAERQQQQQQQQTPVARTSMQPRSAPLGSASSRRGRSRARSVASVPIARVVSHSSSSSSAGRRRQQQQQQQREAVGAVGDDVASVSAAGLGKQQTARQPSVLDAQPIAFVHRPVVLYCTVRRSPCIVVLLVSSSVSQQP